MNVTKIEVDRYKARELMREYRAHRAAQTPQDAAIERCYREIARGRVVIRALDSIAAAGLGPDRLPKLAIVRADMRYCAARVWSDRMTFAPRRRFAKYESNRLTEISVARQTPADQSGSSGVAQAPIIPVHLRPRAALDSYHILWEADWRQPPVDPMLLRRLIGDMWVVVAAWDLTEVERAAMQDFRVSA